MNSAYTKFGTLFTGTILLIAFVSPALLEQSFDFISPTKKSDDNLARSELSKATLEEFGLGSTQAQMLTEQTGEFGEKGLLLTLESLGTSDEQSDMLLAQSQGIHENDSRSNAQDFDEALVKASSQDSQEDALAIE